MGAIIKFADANLLSFKRENNNPKGEYTEIVTSVHEKKVQTPIF